MKGQINLFDTNLEKKIQMAIDLIKLYEPVALQLNSDGYILAFSGGKDSQVCYHLLKMAGVKYRAYYCLTTVDPPELIYHIKNNYPDVKIVHPKETMWELIVRHKMPPLRQMRYCCSDLKEYLSIGFTVTGVRWEESSERACRGKVEILANKKSNRITLNNDNQENRRMIENCQIKGKRMLNPIISWSNDNVWELLKTYKIPYCSLYDEGFERIGCIGCPLATLKNREREFNRWPQYKLNYIKAFDRMLIARVKAGKYTTWKNGVEVFNWWLYKNRKLKSSKINGQYEIEYYVS